MKVLSVFTETSYKVQVSVIMRIKVEEEYIKLCSCPHGFRLLQSQLNFVLFYSLIRYRLSKLIS